VSTATGQEKKVTVFVPEGFQDFECDQCGECCTLPPRITISPARYERLARVLRESSFAVPVRDAVMKDEDDPAASAVFALVGQRCVFLTDAGRCRLYELGVPELRGVWCITFPVSPVITPRGVNYSISFACRKTAAMLGAKQPLNMLALTVAGGQFPGGERTFSAKHRVPIAVDRPKLDWPAHRLIEGLLLAVARDWSVSLADRLTLMPVLLDYVLRDYAGPESDAALRERVSQLGRELAGLLKKARSYRPDRTAHYEALTGLFARRIGLRTEVAIRKQVDAAMRQVHRPNPSAGGPALGQMLGRLYARHYRPRASRIENVLGNYVICRLFASPEMLVGGVYKGLTVICYLVALIRFFAVTSAAEHETTVGKTLLIESVQTVERLFAQGRNLFDFLDSDDEQARMQDPALVAELVRI
jgi:hypothetical protein